MGPGPDTEHVEVGDAVDQLAFVVGAAGRLDLEPSLGEVSYRTRVDVLEQEDAAPPHKYVAQTYVV